MKSISLKGLADFISAGPSKQRTLVRQFKYPKEDDGRAKIMYYREARDVVEAFHRSKSDPSWLHQEARRFESIAASLSGPSRIRLRHNARAIQQYGQHFGTRRFEPCKELRTFIILEEVRITVVPDLHVLEKGESKIIKLEFGVQEPSETEIKVLGQVMYEAFTRTGTALNSSHVLYLDVPRGKAHKGARAGSRMLRTLEDACKTYSAIWNQI